MGLGGIVILLLLIVSLIVFIYVIVITARGWGVLHTILLCTLFIECWVFMIFAAGVHYHRVRFTERAHKARLDAEQAEAQTEQLLWGGDLTAEVPDAVVPLKGLVRRTTADRGRVWRALTYVQPNGDAYQLEMLANDQDTIVDPLDAAAPAAVTSSESLPVDLVVYAFSEEVDEEGRPIPKFYLGEFTVTQSQDGQVNLKPTLQLRKVQADFIAAGNATSWTLYELLPTDSHTAFAAPGSQPSDKQLFGRMDEEMIGALLADLPEDSRDELLEAYLRDGQPVQGDDPAAPPESIWYQVNVLKTFERDVDSTEKSNATVGGYFDLIGRSVDSRLQRDDGKPVQLTPDMKDKPIILLEEVARTLRDSGNVELGQRFRVRPLNDYEEAFNKNFVRSHELSERIELFKRDSAEIQKANQAGQSMISFRQVEAQQLQADLDSYQKEVTVLRDSAAKAEKQLAELKTELGRLFLSVQASRSQLTAGAVRTTASAR